MVANNICKLNIEEYSLDNVTLPTAPARYIEVIVSEHDLSNESLNDEIKLNISYPFPRTKVNSALIKSAKYLTNGETKCVMEVILDTSNLSCDYLPGDTISILPENSKENINIVLECLRLTSKSHNKCDISVLKGTTKKAAKIPPYIVTPTTVFNLLQNSLNIQSLPKKLFLRTLADFTSNSSEKKFLETLCSKDGSQIYTKLTTENSLTFLDILKLCPSCQPPFGILIEHLPRLLPRPYSIANSPLKSTTDIKLLFSILQENPGVTTNYLKNLAEQLIENPSKELKVNIYYRDINKFRYSEEEFQKNIIMISVGCAVAPFLGFLEHKMEVIKNVNGYNDSVLWLFTGFKKHNTSLYENELEELKKIGILNELFVSYSGDSNAKWKYVQEAIIENGEKFIQLLQNDETLLFVCADGAEISKSIQNTIRDCFVKVLNCSQNEADEIIMNYKKNFKYREDIWL